MKETLKKANYQYIRYLGNGEHLLLDLSAKPDYDYRYEVWFSNKSHASYGLIFKNTHLEFARSIVPEYECINEKCQNEKLEKTPSGWYCPSCSCHTVAPEEDGMYPINL
jgi:hypothetical protein